MMVRDRKLKRLVDVVDKGCLKRTRYWPRQDPGSFSQGVGYRTRLNAKGGIDWLCGRREINGCPHPKPEPQTSARKGERCRKQECPAGK